MTASAAVRKHWREGRDHQLLQFRTPINDEIRAALAAQGAVITATVPDDGAVVAVGSDFSPEGLDLVFADELAPEDKVSPLVGTHGNDSAFIIEFHSDVEPDQAKALLESEGLQTIDHPDLAPDNYLILATVDDVERLKGWDEVAYIFPAPIEMTEGERFQNCTGALSSGLAVAQYVRVGQGWSPDESGQVNLGYYFAKMTEKLPEATVRAEVERAMAEWSKVARVNFSLAASASAMRTVSISFETGDHGDGYPFDGPNGILAHTFYPSNPEPIAGDLHFDAAEAWHAGANVDIYTVALHELGHALGLGHSDQPGAIMYPYYRYPSQIGPDDIAGVQSIYGAPLATPASPATPTPALTLTLQSAPPSVLPVNTTAIALNGAVTNSSGPVSVTWQTDHGASGRAAGGASWGIPAIPTPVGSTTVTLTASDSIRKTVKAITLMRPAPAVQDTTAPVLTITSPGGTTILTSLKTISVTGTASDNTDVARITWQSSGNVSGTATGTKTWTASAIPLLVGNNTLIFRAYDLAGNSSWRSVTVVRR